MTKTKSKIFRSSQYIWWHMIRICEMRATWFNKFNEHFRFYLLLLLHCFSSNVNTHTHTKSTSTHARLYTSNSVRIESLRTTLTTSWVKMFYNGTRWRAKAQQLHTVVLYDNTTNPVSERKKKKIDDDKTNNSTWRLKQARYMYKFQ